MATQHVVKAGETLNAISKQYGYSNYKEAGVTSVPSGNFDLIRVGDVITLGGAPKTSSTPTASPAASGGSSPNVSDLINGDQDNDIQTARDADGPGTRNSVKSVNDFYESLTKTINSALGDAPDVPSFTDRFKELRADYGVSDLEEQMNILKQEQRDLDAIKRQRTAGAREKRVSEGVIAGRVSTIERQENERIDANLREQQYLSDQLNTKYNVINTIMGLEQTDYTNAVNSYDKKYSQVVDTLNLARGLRSDQLSEEERVETSARANLQIMYNALSSGAADFDSLDPSAIATITKLEVQSGLPIGFYQALKARAGNAEIVSTNSRENAGVAYTDIIMRNADGSLYVETLSRGGVDVKGGGSGPGNVDAFEFSNSQVGKLVETGMSRSEVTALQKDIDEYGIDVAIEGFDDQTRTRVREILSGKSAEDAPAEITDSKVTSAASIIWKQIEKDAKAEDTLFKWEGNIRKEKLESLTNQLRSGGGGSILKKVLGTDEVSDEDRERLITALEGLAG